MILKSNYDEINFNELYKIQKQNSSFCIKTSNDWDKKASSMNQSVHNSIYIDEFLNRVDFKGVDNILDFACGPGTLSLRVANKVKSVYAYDYSKEMVKFTNENAKNLGISNIKTGIKSFEDNWDDIIECDIVFASRCLEVLDLDLALKKLLSKTKKSLYLSFKVGGSFVDEKILNILEKDIAPRPDYIYLVNILFQMGYLPRLDFIKSENTFINVSNEDEFVKKISWSIDENLNQEQIQKLKQFYNKEFQKQKKHVYWAFIRIDVMDKKC